jgi:two-component system sensor histidine kinase KdpD
VASLVALAVERERYVREVAHVEALRESDQLKSSLLRAVSHDLHSPLTAIALELEALTPLAGEKSAASLASLGNHVARLQRRISNLLAMARIEAGRTQPRIEPTPAADLFRAARESLPGIRDQRRFDVRVHPDSPDLNVDPVLTLELLVNLIENADRASPDGQAVELIAEPAKAMVRIEVRDRGAGITKRDNEFDDVQGRGLGLEIVRNLVRVQGGTFDLCNREGGGAIARVELPAASMMTLEESG